MSHNRMSQHHLPTREQRELMDYVSNQHDVRTDYMLHNAARLRESSLHNRRDIRHSSSARLPAASSRSRIGGDDSDGSRHRAIPFSASDSRRSDDLARQFAREEEESLWR